MLMSYQDRLFNQANGVFAQSLQRRSRRRILVASLVVSVILVGAAIYTMGDRFHLVAIATVPYWLQVHLLNLSLQGLFELSDHRLDEYQVAVRNKAYELSHGMSLVFLVSVVTAAVVLQLDFVGQISTAAVAFLVSVLAPRMITAWVLADYEDAD
jgi:hypothetical protein